MKVEHNFTKTFELLPCLGDRCINCNLEITRSLYKEAFKHSLLIFWDELEHKYPCITEEELLIKNLLE